MRPRTAIGSAAVLLAVVVAVILLRAHPAPPSPVQTNEPPPPPPPVADARSIQLTNAFQQTTELPASYRFDAVHFARYVSSQPDLGRHEYLGTGTLLHGRVPLDHVSVTVAHIAQPDPDFSRCDPTGSHDGSSCTERIFPDGTRAKVVRNAAFAQSVASDVTSGAKQGIQTQLDAVFSDGTLLVVTLDADNGAGIPLDDAAMLRLAAIPVR
ncbi:MAG TPA: hypothetical protein VHV74_12790 [Pseudonocardiaceae bacterium]|nr:hypothetical protein [Pseudonocardiaceae bacterium]